MCHFIDLRKLRQKSALQISCRPVICRIPRRTLFQSCFSVFFHRDVCAKVFVEMQILESNFFMSGFLMHIDVRKFSQWTSTDVFYDVKYFNNEIVIRQKLQSVYVLTLAFDFFSSIRLLTIFLVATYFCPYVWIDLNSQGRTEMGSRNLEWIIKWGFSGWFWGSVHLGVNYTWSDLDKIYWLEQKFGFVPWEMSFFKIWSWCCRRFLISLLR